MPNAIVAGFVNRRVPYIHILCPKTAIMTIDE